MSTATATQTIQVRVDTLTKQNAESVLQELGLNMSQAIKLFLKQISLNKSIPFAISLTPAIPFVDAETEKAIAQGLEEYRTGQTITLKNKQDIENFINEL